MPWLLLLGLHLLNPASEPEWQDPVYLRSKIVYCYTRYSITSQDPESAPTAREHAKASSDLLFPRYQRALQDSKGTLAETLLTTEASKARTAEHRLSITEFFMTQEVCDSLVKSDPQAAQ
jgi:hypothetical protein